MRDNRAVVLTEGEGRPVERNETTMPAVELDLEFDAEAELVRIWRMEELERAGYPASEARRLADLTYVDLHLATDLLRRGCSPELAFKILV